MRSAVLIVLHALLATAVTFGAITDCARLLADPRPRLALVAPVRQSTAQVAALYAQAEAAKPRFDRAMTMVAAATGAVYVPRELKGMDRFEAKVRDQKGGNAAYVLDIVRGALVCENIDGVYAALREVESAASLGAFAVLRVSDRFHYPKDSGYRDVHVNIAIAGHVVELQIHLRTLYELKKGEGDALYREIRELEESPSPRDEARLKELRNRHRQLYDEAFFLGY